ncbi:MAG: type II toxin-antitoxin system VapC family toxin [Chloroflexota bacterium]|nr:type II toxin-antitoxin system VapC family toxin [Chloroflexota bacterium]
MNYLLDPHVFIWLDNDPDSLSPAVTRICADPRNSLFVSVASVWEMQIKRQVGKLGLPLPIDQMVRQQISTNGIRISLVQLPHVYTLDQLTLHHRDPFDRILIAQAMTESLVILTTDPQWYVR